MPPPSERHEARRKKKNFYAQLKKQEDTKLQELAEKYRDRARERRDGSNQDYQAIDPSSSANAYRAVAPDSKSGLDAAERRRQLIQESKFLGGDMEHTHLVKGLDYALLQKVRSEIIVKEQEQEIEMEKLAEMAEQNEEERDEEYHNKADEPEYRTIMGRNIFNTIQYYRSRNVERNELYAPGRMAYSYDVTEVQEEIESDIPTTLIRSKADVPQNEDDLQTLTTNDIVINKLAEILLYLRQGGKGKKNKRRDKDKPLLMDDDHMRSRDNERNRSSRDTRDDRDSKSSKNKTGDISIYDDLDDYRPSRRGDDDGPSTSSKHRSNRNYFDKSSEQEEREAGSLTGIHSNNIFHFQVNIPINGSKFVLLSAPAPPKINSTLISKLSGQVEGYAECYPGLQEMNDAIDDSDDEVDYTKMDLGNKKGPIGRWDFDTQEEYSDYMSSKEALPKAAFQYGVKMQDGRKTRKNKTEKNEKAELDREWQKIQNIIHKRKNKEGGSSRDGEPDYKVPKY